MKHRLIPYEDRVRIHREYHARVLAILFSSLAVAAGVGVAALFPAYIRAEIANRSAAVSVEEAKGGSAVLGLDEAERDLAASKALLQAAAADQSAPVFSAVIRSVLASHSPISISAMRLDRQGTSTMVISIDGVAPTRNDLLAWKSRLESLQPGSKVDLPISVLAKNVDVPFSLRLTQTIR